MDIESNRWIEFLNGEKTMKVNLIIETEIKDFGYLVATNPIEQKNISGVTLSLKRINL